MQDLLFLSQRIPYPPNKGDKIRSFHVLQELTRRYHVHLGCFVDDPADWQHVDKIRSMVASCCVLPLSRSWARLRSARALLTGDALSVPFYADRHMAEWVRGTVAQRKPAAAYLFSSPMAQYVMAGPRPRRIVMDFVDVDSQKWSDYAAGRPGMMAAIYRREGRKLLQFERTVAQFADAGIFVSVPERDLFQTLAPESADRTHAIGNGTDTEYFSPDRPYSNPFDDRAPALVFTGAMDYWPNIEAICWFSREVLPLVRHLLPATRLSIVGLNPAREVIALADIAGVTVTGRVPDVRPFLAHADAIIAPLLTARGIQNKVLEGMAMARPVVATSQAFEGIDAVAGRHLIVADGAPAFAAGVVRAVIDPLARDMGRTAREQIRRLYGWDKTLPRFHTLLAANAEAGEDVAFGKRSGWAAKAASA